MRVYRFRPGDHRVCLLDDIHCGRGALTFQHTAVKVGCEDRAAKGVAADHEARPAENFVSARRLSMQMEMASGVLPAISSLMTL